MAFQALFSCQIRECAQEISFYADMLGIWKGDPICHNCYDEHRTEDDPYWGHLPRITMADIKL